MALFGSWEPISFIATPGCGVRFRIYLPRLLLLVHLLLPVSLSHFPRVMGQCWFVEITFHRVNTLFQLLLLLVHDLFIFKKQICLRLVFILKWRISWSVSIHEMRNTGGHWQSCRLLRMLEWNIMGIRRFRGPFALVMGHTNNLSWILSILSNLGIMTSQITLFPSILF